MSQAMVTPLPVGMSVVPGSLRAELDARRAAGTRFSIKEAIAVVVPICVQLVGVHAQGKMLYVHPSSLGYGPGGDVTLLEDRAQVAPTLPRDRACLAPEERKGSPGDARASVFAVGAILYELLTGAPIGPGMRRPSEMVENLPPSLEAILGKALVAEPKHRPGDLGALAQALHHVSPNASIAPPPADESHLDSDADFEVDVRLSMIPPNEHPVNVGGAPIIPKAAAVPRIQVQGEGPYAVIQARPAAPVRNAGDPTQRLADMKAALESDSAAPLRRDQGRHGSRPVLRGRVPPADRLRPVHPGERPARHASPTTSASSRTGRSSPPSPSTPSSTRTSSRRRSSSRRSSSPRSRARSTRRSSAWPSSASSPPGAAGLWLRDRANKDHDREVQGDKAMAVDVDGGLSSAPRRPRWGTDARRRRRGPGRPPRPRRRHELRGRQGQVHRGLRQVGAARPLGRRVRQRAQQGHLPQRLRRAPATWA